LPENISFKVFTPGHPVGEPRAELVDGFIEKACFKIVRQNLLIMCITDKVELFG
jgi:hypothetical protein